MARPTVVGITGTIGSGKSLVGTLLKTRGFTVIDTDEVVHQLFASDAELQRAIGNRFGTAVLTKRNEIDRPRLGAIVFSDEEARKDLEAIVHPAVVRECERLILEHLNEKCIFFLVPLLFEAGLSSRYDKIWAVTTDDSVLRERLQARTNLSDEEMTARFAAQMSQSQKASLAHRVIDNSGSIADTEKQVNALLQELGV